MHYVYDDKFDGITLMQGDVLNKTEELTEILTANHPNFGSNLDNILFMVLTQSCDLVRRDGAAPVCPCIALSPVRPIETILVREATRFQEHAWQTDGRALGKKSSDRLAQLVQRLLDNNEDSYFYLHADAECQIYENCCAILTLSIPLEAHCYEICLKAKIAQLKETFQAKLGALIGKVYNRVGTVEWDTHFPGKNVRTAASELLKGVFTILDDERIKEGIDDLKAAGNYENMKSLEILKYVHDKQIATRSQKFKNRAEKVLLDGFNELSKVIKGHLKTAFKKDEVLKEKLTQTIVNGKELGISELINQVINEAAWRIDDLASDPGLLGRDAIVKTVLAAFMQDAVIKSILK